MALNLNINQLIKQTAEEISKDLENEIKLRIKKASTRKLDALFATSEETARYREYCRVHRIAQDSDYGYARELIESMIDDKLSNDESLNQYITEYTARNYNRILDAAIEKALTHKANKAAFSIIKSRKET